MRHGRIETPAFNNCNPVNLLVNGNFSHWTAGDTSAPDGWNLWSGSPSATITKETTIVKIGTASVALTSHNGEHTPLQQTTDGGKGIEYWRGRTVTLGCWVWADAPGIAGIFLHDGIDDFWSDQHPGDSSWHWLTVTMKLNDAAVVLLIQLATDQNLTAYFDGAVLCEGTSAFAYGDQTNQEALNGIVDPTAVIPDYIGQIYVNTTPTPGSRGMFVANGLGVGEWVDITSSPVPPSAAFEFKIYISGSFMLPLVYIAPDSYDFVVDWGDGTSDTITTYNAPQRTHVYPVPWDTYTIKITGKCEGFVFYDHDHYVSTPFRVTEIVTWGDVVFKRLNLANCNSMTSLPNERGKLTQVTEFGNFLALCDSLTTIPDGIFDGNTIATDFAGCFTQCTSLTAIPVDLFKDNIAATTFLGCFHTCGALTSIPVDLFRYNTQATNFQGTFVNCTNLTDIPVDLFKYNTLATNFRGTFIWCSGLTSIPTDLFRYNTQAVNMDWLFESCHGLTSLPDDLFRYNTLNTTFNRTFNYCDGLTSLPADLFRYNTLVTDFTQTFSNCTGLVGEIPADLFRYNVLAERFNYVFTGCSSFTGSIPTDLFRYNVAAKFFTYAFMECTGLTGSIPETLFADNPLVIDFTGVFHTCSNLTGVIPELLFANNPLVDAFRTSFRDCRNLTGTLHPDLFKYNTVARSFLGTFMGCSGITGSIPVELLSRNPLVYEVSHLFGGMGISGEIPEDLFLYNPALTTLAGTFEFNPGLTGAIPAGLFANSPVIGNLFHVFEDCTGLTSIPADLFKFNPLLSQPDGIFIGCSGLTGSIPVGLFDYNPQAYSFRETFRECSGLTGPIPSGLFRNNINVHYFNGTFYGCKGLQYTPDIFYSLGEEGTRFLNLLGLDFTQCFYRVEFTGVKGTAPDLWNCDYGTGTGSVIKTQCFSGVGNSLLSLDNYNDIPIAWGGSPVPYGPDVTDPLYASASSYL